MLEREHRCTADQGKRVSDLLLFGKKRYHAPLGSFSGAGITSKQCRPVLGAGVSLVGNVD